MSDEHSSEDQKNPTLNLRQKFLELSFSERTDRICSYFRKRISDSCELPEDDISADIDLSELNQNQAKDKNPLAIISAIIRDELGLLLHKRGESGTKIHGCMLKNHGMKQILI